jgi:predicted CXXCH cytochrome family protein
LTYLVETDGFLVESPVTWYTARKAWGMSPGYDHPDHKGFMRPTGEECLVCHAGQARAVGGSAHRMHIAEAAISCERCHGPGSLHVERHGGQQGQAGKPPEEIDHTIVNPAHLSRELCEAVCQQCHLRSNAQVVARGRKGSDFRPGLPLQDFRHDYQLEVPDSSMTVVGHVEQMHLSRCYQGSKDLTCLTCHDPHAEPRPAESTQYYRDICLKCHRPEHCQVSKARLQKESPDNNCVQCHMPRSDTEIPHLAFTHHRIGVFEKPPVAPKDYAGSSGGPGVLRPFLDLSRLSAIDRKWSLGLAYLDMVKPQRDVTHMGDYQQRALELLSEVRSEGLRDPVLDISLAVLRFDLGLDNYLPLSESALTHPKLSALDRCTALYLRANTHARQGRHKEAAAAILEMTRLRRNPVDWLLLADCQKALGDPAAVDSLEMAVRITPRLWKIHQYLADHYRRQGDKKRAAWHERRAVP